jgi:peptidyl-prolyl cis-trans isomerase-like 4
MGVATPDLISCHLFGFSRLGSQFFITLGSELQSLDGEHCVFGEVVEGREVLLKLNEVICDSEHRPYQDVRYSCTPIWNLISTWRIKLIYPIAMCTM